MSWLIALVVLAAYLAVARAVSSRCSARYAASHARSFPHLTASDPERYRREARFMGGLGGLFWPVVMVGWLSAAALLALAGKPPKFPGEVEQERQQMAARIAQLEHELGIGGQH